MLEEKKKPPREIPGGFFFFPEFWGHPKLYRGLLNMESEAQLCHRHVPKMRGLGGRGDEEGESGGPDGRPNMATLWLQLLNCLWCYTKLGTLGNFLEKLRHLPNCGKKN